MNDLCLMFINNEVILLNRDQLLMISDLASQRFILTLTAYLSSKLGVNNYLTVEELNMILNWGDDYLEGKRSNSYAVIYKWEALCVSVLISKDTTPLGNFQQDLLNDVAKGHPDSRILFERGITLLLELYRRSHHKVAQAYGLYRIWGHPIINAVAGALALQEVAKVYRHGSTSLKSCINGKFAEIFTHRYWKKTGSWPQIDTTSLGHYHPISQAKTNNSMPPTLPRESLGHWCLVKFRETFQISPKFDILEMLSDKAMSLPLNELVTSVRKDHNIGFAEARSVIVKWLKSTLSDPGEFLRQIDINGFPNQEIVIGVCPKEREGKIKARMFSLLTLYKRMYVVITEALISEHIIPLFQEVTMTDDALTLTKKQIKFTKDSASGVKKKINQVRYSCLDFVKWNSNMREMDTKGMFTMIDNLFGLNNCIARTHEMFQQSRLYLADSYFLPPVSHTGNLIENPGIWVGHLGGMEGLRQKGWTVWTVCLLLLVAEKITGKLELMGQGDNQVIKITYKDTNDPEEINKRHTRFLSNLSKVLRQIGPPLKLEETWTSSDTYIYGKFIIHKGVPLSMSMKKIARMFHLSNDMYPTIESSLSSLSANCIAACGSDLTPIIPFIIYGSEVMSCVYHNMRSVYLHKIPLIEQYSNKKLSYSIPYHGVNVDRLYNPQFESISLNSESSKKVVEHCSSFDSDFQTRILLCPRNLGGLPVLLLPNLLMRRFPDPTVLSISTLKAIYLKSSDTSTRNIIIDILSPRLASSRNFELLLENPTALNLATPSSPSEGKRDLLLQYFKLETEDPNTWIINTAFKYFLNETDANQDKLASYLMEFRPCFPRLLSEVWAATPLARARHAMGKIGKAKTLLRLAAKKGLNMLKKIIKSEVKSVASTLYMYYDKSESNLWHYNLCSVEWVDHLRLRSWGVRLEGLTAVPPYECFEIQPLDYPSDCTDNHNLQVSPNSIRVLIDPNLIGQDITNSLILGGFTPYIGSSTKETTTGHGKTLAAVCPPIAKRPLGLSKLIGWATEYDSNLTGLIQHIIETVTDLDPEGLEPDSTQIAGTIHHRINDMRTDHGGGASLLYTHFTKLQYHSADLKEYSKGSSNTNLMFQAVYLYFSSILSMEFELGTFDIPPSYHIHLKSKCCIQDVNEEKIDGPNTDFTLLLPHPSEKNAFNWCPKETILSYNERQAWSPSPTCNKRDSKDIDILVSIVAESSMKIVRNHYLRDPGGAPPNSGRMPYNWAIRTPPKELLYNLSLRIFSMFLSCCMTGIVRYQDMLTSLSQFVRDISDSGFTHMDTLLSISDLMDYLITERLIDHSIADPSLPRQAVGHHFHKVITRIILSFLTGQADIPHLRFVSNVVCPLDQVPILLNLTKLIASSAVSKKVRLTRVYRSVRKYLNESRDANKFPDQITLVIRSALMKECGRRNTETYRSLMSRCSRDYHNYLPESYCKQFPPVKLRVMHTKVTDKLTKQLKSEILRVENESTMTKEIYLNFALRPKKFLNPVHRLKDSGTEFKDHSSWEYKTLNLPSSACYKLAGVLRDNYDFIPQKVGTVATLADGAGGFAYLMGMLDSNCSIIYNTLKIPNDDIEQNPMLTYIPALTACPEIKKRTICTDLLEEGITNLLDKRFEHQLKRSYQGSIQIMTCDAEAVSQYGNIQLSLLHNILRVAVSYNTELVVYKSYYLDLCQLERSIRMAAVYYRKIRISRSSFSSSTNTEIYIVCAGLSGNSALKDIMSDPNQMWIADVDEMEIRSQCEEIVRQFEEFELDPNIMIHFADSVSCLLKHHQENVYSLENILRIFLTIGVENWQQALMSWVSRSLSTPEQKVLQRRGPQHVRCSKENLVRFATQWILVMSVYCDLTSHSINMTMREGVLLLYRATLPTRIGSLVIVPLNKSNLTVAQGDRCVELKTIIGSKESAYIFREIGLAFCRSHSQYGLVLSCTAKQDSAIMR